MKSPKRILYIDLGECTHEITEQPELFDKYLGGSGLAISLLHRECPQGIDPFAPENPLILAPGPFGGLFPSAGKTVASFKSPITGNLGESHAGGRLASCMRLAGYEALVIKNSATNLTFLEIGEGGVVFHDASPLKGYSSLEVERRLRICAALARMQSIVSIGQAGENRVSYACVNVDRYNCFGRLGLGAIFGSKNLKAISFIGSGSIEVPDPQLYREVFMKLYKEEIETDKMGKYHFTGTPANVLILNEIKALPTKNFQNGSFEYAEAICGETLGKTSLDRKVSCPLCPIGCMHVARLRPAFAQGYEYEPIDIYNNYESIYALGSNLCVKTSEEVLRLIYRANYLGIDSILVGNVLAWATEAYEKHLIDKRQMGDIVPRWGDTEAYAKMMDNIALGSNEFYERLAQGLEKAAEFYGGRDYAMVLGGSGLAGYYTGYASILGTIVGSRHSHNDNAGYDVDQRILQRKIGVNQIVNELIGESDWRYLLSSLVVCLFARSIYTKERVVEALGTIGIERTPDELKKLGNDIYRLAFEFKFREGFDFNKISLPKRIFESATASGKMDEETLRNTLKEYLRKAF